MVSLFDRFLGGNQSQVGQNLAIGEGGQFQYSPQFQTSNQTTDSRQYSTATTTNSVFAPTYNLAFDSAGASFDSKKDASIASAQNPNLSNAVSPSLSPNATSAPIQYSQPPQSAPLFGFGGGTTGTVALIGVAAVAAYLVIGGRKK
jgi:hypothetical protein